MLTWKAAFRFRFFWVLAALLLGAVILLPLMLKDDGTAQGFTQILLTYNLSIITALLGVSTLWLACGTLATEIEDRQIQLVVVKPIARWQVWLGKWLGILMLDAALLAIAGASVFLLLLWRAQQLPAEQQAILRNEVFVARGSVTEPLQTERELNEAVEKIVQERLRQVAVPLEEQDLLRTQVREQFLASEQVVGVGYRRVWDLDMGLQAGLLRNQNLFIRSRFYAAETNMAGIYQGLWVIGPPGAELRTNMVHVGGGFSEFEIPASLIGSDGKLHVEFWNRNSTRLLFPLEDGMEVLYRQGSFAANYARGLALILCQLALLAAIGLTAASLLSFPVAAFCTFSLLAVTYSSGTLSSVVDEGTLGAVDHETGARVVGLIDILLMPIFKLILAAVDLSQTFSPVDSLSTGRSIPWKELATAIFRVVILFAGSVGLVGMICLSRRELATAQQSS